MFLLKWDIFYCQVGDSNQQFVILARSGSHYNLVATEVFPFKHNCFHPTTYIDTIQACGIFTMAELTEVIGDAVMRWGLEPLAVEEEEEDSSQT